MSKSTNASTRTTGVTGDSIRGGYFPNPDDELFIQRPKKPYKRSVPVGRKFELCAWNGPGVEVVKTAYATGATQVYYFGGKSAVVCFVSNVEIEIRPGVFASHQLKLEKDRLRLNSYYRSGSISSRPRRAGSEN